MDMDDLEDVLTNLIAGARAVIRTELTSIWVPIQLGSLALALLIAVGISVYVRRRFDLAALTMGWPAYLRMVVRAITSNLTILIFIAVVLLMRIGFQAAIARPRIYLLDVATHLASAWMIIAIATSLIRNQFVNRVVAVTAWTVAALNILGILDATAARLDGIAVVIGGLRVTPLLVLKTSALLIITLWAATAASNFFDRRVRGIPDITPSVQVLLAKLIRIALMAVAVVLVLGSVGIDLSVLAVFTGAVGVGIGFGLQKIVSNLVSGIILLADKSIKPGDVISVGDQVGWVGHMGARYTSVDTRDGREFLIPNEDFITQRVINLSYSDNLVRLDVPFNVTYGCDPHVVKKVAAEAAATVARVLNKPAPTCYLTAFAPSAIEYRLLFWIGGPAGDLGSVRSDVLTALWDTFKREKIDIPQPSKAQRIIVEQAAPTA